MNRLAHQAVAALDRGDDRAEVFSIGVDAEFRPVGPGEGERQRRIARGRWRG